MLKIGDYFSEISDFRVFNRCLHFLSDILGLVLCGTLADCDTFIEIADYGEDNLEFLKSDLGFSFPNGIPSEDTLERVFNHLNPSEIQQSYHRLVQDLSLAGKHIAIDGKELRSTIAKNKKHSNLQMVNMWIDEFGLSFGQQRVAQKSNEIKAIPGLLQTIDCQDSIITIDAIGCQKEIVKQIRVQEADYVIGLKKNQKTLYEQVKAEMQRQKNKAASSVTRNLEHGRGELRKIYVCETLDFVDAKEAWQDLKSVILVERTRWVDGKKQYSESLYISSLENKMPEEMGQYIRNHWAIENRLHWQLDVTFREDKAHTKNENALQNLHLMKKWALFLFKKDSDKISVRRKRKKANRNQLYLKYLIQ